MAKLHHLFFLTRQHLRSKLKSQLRESVSLLVRPASTFWPIHSWLSTRWPMIKFLVSSLDILLRSTPPRTPRSLFTSLEDLVCRTARLDSSIPCMESFVALFSFCCILPSLLATEFCAASESAVSFHLPYHQFVFANVSQASLCHSLTSSPPTASSSQPTTPERQLSSQ